MVVMGIIHSCVVQTEENFSPYNIHLILLAHTHTHIISLNLPKLYSCITTISQIRKLKFRGVI